MTDRLMVEGIRERAELRREANATKRVRALELIAEGHTVKHAAIAVGRPRNTVAAWKREAHGTIQS